MNNTILYKKFYSRMITLLIQDNTFKDFRISIRKETDYNNKSNIFWDFVLYLNSINQTVKPYYFCSIDEYTINLIPNDSINSRKIFDELIRVI